LIHFYKRSNDLTMNTQTIISSLIILISYFNTGSGLQCYVCNRQDGNTEKCLTTIKTCKFEQDRCLSTIRWSTTPYWTQGAEKQYYVSKRCSTREECDRIIKESMTLCHYIWYEDWKCAECCQGDRCNYYVTLGSNSLSANMLTLLLIPTTLLILLR